jgi:NADPH:quinone reductase-like Zn-dependent oxidoreductase
MLPCTCEVLVEVMASSVNPCDRGTDSARNPKVLGSDVAGKVVAIGQGCQRLKVGDEVWADIGAVVKLKSSGQSTKELGAYAQYAVAIETQLGLKPKALGWAEAGSLPKVALTSYKALVWYCGAPWKTKPTVLILVSHSCACIGSPCLRQCVHGAPIGRLGWHRHSGHPDRKGDGRG